MVFAWVVWNEETRCETFVDRIGVGVEVEVETKAENVSLVFILTYYGFAYYLIGMTGLLGYSIVAATLQTILSPTIPIYSTFPSIAGIGNVIGILLLLSLRLRMRMRVPCKRARAVPGSIPTPIPLIPPADQSLVTVTVTVTIPCPPSTVLSKAPSASTLDHLCHPSECQMPFICLKGTIPTLTLTLTPTHPDHPPLHPLLEMGSHSHPSHPRLLRVLRLQLLA